MSTESLAEVRAVLLLLTGVYLEAQQRYVAGWSDAIVAKATGVQVDFVVRVCFGAFGPDASATEFWRLCQAIMLIARRFDHTVELDARDRIVDDLGPEALAAMQARGDAPAAGRWEAGWSDDHVAALAGLDPGQIRQLRDAIPWTPPADRPDERRRRFMCRYTTATRPGRILRLSELREPGTDKFYSPPKILEALGAAGEGRGSAPEYRRDLERIETMIELTQARLDPVTGFERTIRAIAQAMGRTHGTVHYQLGLIDSGEMPAEGRPSLLTTDVCERVERANPLRVNRRATLRWLIGWIWLHADSPPGDRTVQGWRQTGARHIGANRETIAARFEAAVRRLVDAAPDAPRLPQRAEIEAAGEGLAAAETLGVTMDQLAAARRAAGMGER
jgi:hypothetical protein